MEEFGLATTDYVYTYCVVLHTNVCVVVGAVLQLLISLAEFYGMETWLLKRSVASLQAKGKAEYIRGLAPDDSDSGVKFFA